MLPLMPLVKMLRAHTLPRPARLEEACTYDLSGSELEHVLQAGAGELLAAAAALEGEDIETALATVTEES